MKIKCEYCGGFISDTDEKCPNCGGINAHLVRNSNKAPKTIEELKQWYQDRNLPPEETTRFFIGTNYKNPRAFGIYKDEESGNFIVYKNKGNGVRAIRYEGKDEAYAVNELYLKLKSEIINQKSRNLNNHSSASASKQKKSNLKILGIFFGIYALILGIIVTGSIFTPHKGYYHYNDSYYYYQSGSWYRYNDYYGWDKTSVPDELKNNHSDYYDSSYYNSNYDIDYNTYDNSFSELDSTSTSKWPGTP